MAEITLSYNGRSMLPTLKAGDILRVIQYNKREIQVGDVIAFHSANEELLTVHRVVSVDLNGVRTKGDNNFRIDELVLSPAKIVGRVLSVHRGRRKIIIFNGLKGVTYAFVLSNLIKIYNALLPVILSPAYHWLSDTRILQILPLSRRKFRLCCFKHGDDPELQLLLGRWVIGRLLPGHNKWHIKRPFRLFVDERSLPNCDFLNQVFPKTFSNDPVHQASIPCQKTYQ